MTALYVIGGIALIVGVRVLISVVVRGTVRAAARPIGKAIQNRSIQNESDRVVQRVQAQQNLNGQYGNPPYGAGQYPNPQSPNDQYGAPNYGAPQQQYGAPQQQYGAPQQQYGAPQYGTTSLEVRAAHRQSGPSNRGQ